MEVSHTLSEQQTKLERALLHFGQFSGALHSIEVWVTETLELVDAQKPIAAADPKVLSAQLNEQKVTRVRFDFMQRENRSRSIYSEKDSDEHEVEASR